MSITPKAAFERNGLICECFFGLGMQIKDIAKVAQCDKIVVSNAISLYFKKPVATRVLQSKINIVVKRKPRFYVTATIIDLQTGIFYDNCAELSKAVNRPHRTIHGYIHGDRNQKIPRWINLK